jgi:hypothetical protein
MADELTGDDLRRERPRKTLDAAEVLAGLAAWWGERGPAQQPPEAADDDGYIAFLQHRTAERIAGGKHDQQVPAGISNPYWEIIRQLPLEDLPLSWQGRPEPMLHWMGDGGFRAFADRFDMCATYSWSICSPGDITWLQQILSGRGVIEVGAGGGYWAWQMRQAGIDVLAYDPNEAGPSNGYARRTWTGVLPGDHTVAQHHPGRALFLCWPSYSDDWAARALACYEGDLLVYAGEGEGGCTADDEFFALRDAGWEEIGGSPAHVSYWGIHCYLSAYLRKAAPRLVPAEEEGAGDE